MGLITAAAGGGNWTTGSTWVGGVAPTAADDALLTSASGNVTIDSGGAVCRSLDCNTYAGTLTHNSSSTLTVGDGTAGTGNIALRLVSGMTYTKGSATTSAISFISTSATVQTVTCGGKALGNTTFNASSNGSWQFSDAFSCGTATLTLTKGTLDTNGQSVAAATVNLSNSNTRTLTLGASTITLTNGWTATTVTNLTFNANTSTITFSGTSVSFVGGGLTYNNVTASGAGSAASVSGANTYANLSITGTNGKTAQVSFDANQTISSTLTLAGNSAINRLLVFSSAVGTARTLTAATVTCSNVDLQDITGAGAGSWNLSAITGNSGDCGGNSGITFTTAATQTATGTASFTWSTHGWTSRVPLPQDDVVINNAFVAGRTVTQDMPRAGKSINFTGATGTPTFTNSVIFTMFGSLTFISGMAVTSGTNRFIFGGRSSCTLTTAGNTINTFSVIAPGGSLTLQDNTTAITSTNGLGLSQGTLDFNNFNVSVASLDCSGSGTRTLTLGSGTLTLTGTGTVYNSAVTSNLTLTATSGTIKITDTSSTARTFSGGGKTYGNFWSAAGASTASLTIAGSNTFTDFKDDGSVAHSILFTAGTTQTVTTFTVSGTAGNLITINSTTTATHALVKAGGGTISRDYLNIQHSVATPSSTWYAGTHSTDNQAVATAGSGWTFTDAPAGGVSGTSAQTLPKITQAAEGDVLTQGTSAQTLFALSQAALGNLPILGTSAQTLPRFSESGTGSTPIVGVGAQTLLAFLQEAAGAVSGSTATSVGQGAGPSEIIYEETRKRKTIRVTRALKKVKNKHEKAEITLVDIEPLVDILLEPYGQAYLLRQIAQQIENQNLQLEIYKLLEAAFLNERMFEAGEKVRKYSNTLAFIQKEKEARQSQKDFEELLLLIL